MSISSSLFVFTDTDLKCFVLSNTESKVGEQARFVNDSTQLELVLDEKDDLICMDGWTGHFVDHLLHF